MTNYEYITSKNIEELTEWLDKFGNFEKNPWLNWFDFKYCSKCEPVVSHEDDLGRSVKCSWCEMHGDKCKYFKDLDEIPDNKQMIRMWLERERWID